MIFHRNIFFCLINDIHFTVFLFIQPENLQTYDSAHSMSSADLDVADSGQLILGTSFLDSNDTGDIRNDASKLKIFNYN